MFGAHQGKLENDMSQGSLRKRSGVFASFPSALRIYLIQNPCPESLFVLSMY